MAQTEYPQRSAKVGAVIVLLGSSVWVQWPIQVENLSIAAVLIFIGSFVTWISMEIVDFQKRPLEGISEKNDDVEKINLLIGLLDKHQFIFLKEEAIGTYIKSDGYEGLSDLLRYQENDIFPFHSHELQGEFEDFCREARVFLSHLWSLYTSDGKGNATWRPRRDDGWVPQEQYDQTITEVYRLNIEASDLADKWSSLIGLARSELKGATVKLNPYEL